MVKSLRILNVEDSERDVALLKCHFSSAGYDVFSERVNTAEAMKVALAEKVWDVVLCDYSMLQFNALAALDVLHHSGKDIPFIIISGTVREDVAVEAMLMGANDYLSKDNLTRLIPAVERELQEAKGRNVRRLAEFERKIVFEIIQGIITTPNLTEFLKLVHRSICQIVYAENCFVVLHDPATDLIHYEFWVDKYDPPPPPRPIGKGFGSYVLRTGKPLLITEDLKKRIVEAGEAEPIGTYSPSWLGVPLRTPSRTIGVLVLQHYEDEHAFDQRDLEFLSSVGDQIALAIERKRAEDALGDSEERYRELVENAMDIIYTHDLDGNYTSVNKAGERITGYTRDESIGLSLVQTVAPEYLPKAREMVVRKLSGEEITAYDLEIIAKDGSRIPIEVNTRIIYENGIPVGVQGIARDIRERRLLEDQLRQSQKLEGIGLLAGGIAHDFNNLLTVINGYGDLTLRSMPVSDPLRINVVAMKDAGDRAAALTSQLLAFSRKQVLQPRVHNLNVVITDLEKMLRRIIRESIEFRTVLDPELGNIKADPGQIEQVIMNLSVNARDAMPNGGILTIETENVHLDEEYASQHMKVVPGPFVEMTVTDTGEGMEEKIRRRIFEPFFTTKELGKGTGLGLSTVHGIVKQSGGDILVSSEVGQGTTFKIYLPCVDETIQKPKWTDDEDYSGTETILLVEDEEIVRNLVRQILTSYGYNVLEAVGGNDALAICETYCEPIYLLLTDVIMPGMSGWDLKDRVGELYPSIKILFMSGYADETITQSGILDSGAAFIEKPFSPDDLACKVREVLESR
jgi:PAS domain S-box-containing protein